MSATINKLLYSLQVLTLAITVSSQYESIAYIGFKVTTALVFPLAAAPIYKKAAISYCIGDILLSIPCSIAVVFGGVSFICGHIFIILNNNPQKYQLMLSLVSATGFCAIMYGVSRLVNNISTIFYLMVCCLMAFS